MKTHSARIRVVVLALAALVLIPSTGWAQGNQGFAPKVLHDGDCIASVDCRRDDCNREESLFCYLEENDPGQDGIVILALDHQRHSSWWRGYQWGAGELCRLQDRYFELGPEDRPRLSLPKGHELAVYVVDTNPLVYTLTPGESSVEDRADLANLMMFVDLLAGSASTALQIGGQFTRVARGTSQIGAVMNVEVATRDDPSLDRSEIQRGLSDEQIGLQNLEGDLTRIQKAMEGSARALKPPLEELVRASRSLDSTLKEFGRREGEVQSYVRSVEMGTALDPSFQWPSMDEIEQGFRGVLAARNDLDAAKPVCASEIEALHQVIELKMDGLSSVPRMRRDQVPAFSRALSTLRNVTGCPTLRDHLLKVVDWLDEFPPSLTPDPQVSEVLEPFEKLLRDYLDLVAKRGEVIANANKALGERGAAAKAGQMMAILESRQHDFLATCPTACSRRYGVLPVARAQGQEVDVTWSEIRTESFEVAFDETFQDLVIPTRKKLTPKYELERDAWWQDFDIDFGLTYTELADPEFSAVTIPEPAEALSMVAPAMADEEMPDLKMIARTDEDTRAGDVALFATWVPFSRRGFHLGPQIGFGLDPDEPQAFAGVALGFGPYVKLSGGWTWQEIRALDGQVEDVTLVGSDDDIKLRREFEDDYYISLTISIDNLPFWGGGGGDEE